MKPPALLALDGGGSKIDAVVLSATGEILGAARWPGSVYLGLGGSDGQAGSLEGLATVVEGVCVDAGIDHTTLPIADLGVYCLAGADLPADDRRIARALKRRGWTREDVVRNDTFAVLRAGSERGWGVAVVCGYGINCAGVAPDGRTLRFPALGPLSGDWGGGMAIGTAALWHAVRDQDGRGERTSLRRLVPAHFGFSRPTQVMEAMYFGRMSEMRLWELPPVVFGAAAEGDGIARSIIDRQADEIVAMAGSAIRRLKIADLDVDVVLGGGIFRNDDHSFFERIEHGLQSVAPKVRLASLSVPPVVGAALLGLDRLGASKRAIARVRSTLTHQRLISAGFALAKE